MKTENIKYEIAGGDYYRSRVRTEPALSNKYPRNSPCYCGSGKKFKKCCIWKDVPEAL